MFNKKTTKVRAIEEELTVIQRSINKFHIAKKQIDNDKHFLTDEDREYLEFEMKSVDRDIFHCVREIRRLLGEL